MGNDKRCGWCGNDPLYVAYHDEEWGRETNDDRRLFEFLILESAQAGLSWITILRKRENYRRAFAGFDPEEVAAFTQKDVERLMQDQGIVRNRLKIEAAINNARCFIETAKEFGSFDSYMRSFLPHGKIIINTPQKLDDIPVSTTLSDRISHDMRRRGFRFFGTTICYSYLQAVGYINDHIVDCHCKYADHN